MGRLYDELLNKAASGGKPATGQLDSPREEVLKLACDVLGSEAQAQRWLHLPKIALKGRAPIQLLNTDAGCAEVRALLNKVWD